MDPGIYFGIAMVLIYLSILICYITLVVNAFTHEEPLWGIALILLFWCGLVPLIYGWIRAGDWDTVPLMIAFTASVVGRVGLWIVVIAIAAST